MAGHIPYEPGFGRPAPVCKLVVAWNDKSDVVDAVIDSGASRTVIPRRLIDHLQLRQTGAIPAGGAFTPIGPKPIYQADITVSLLNKEFRALTVFVQDRDHALLGRDVLNQHHLILDGPEAAFSIT
jgi:predicted aspartyl protease